jgi:hypothetical protein
VFPGCDEDLRRGCLACKKHWFMLNGIQQAKARKLHLYDRDRYAAEIFLQDQFAQMKGDQP